MRVRLKVQKKFSVEKIFLFIAILCVASFSILEYTSISIPVFSMMKNPLLHIGGVCILTQFKTIAMAVRKKKYFYVCALVLIFCVFLSLSAYENRNPEIGNSPIRGMIRMMQYLLELMALTIWVSEKGYTRFFVNFLFYYILIIVLINDILLFSGFLRFSDGRYESYLVGTKFNVSYLHMDLLMLWFIKGNAQNSIKNIPVPILLISVALLIMISIRVQCVTGVLGCICLVAGFVVIDKPSRRGLGALNYPVVLIGALMVSLIFPFISKLIVSIPMVKWFIVEVLGRSENLTGRIEIFQIFSDQMSGHWLFGFGFGNENLAAKELFGYANAQNALLQWILRAGVINTVLLVCLMVLIFHQRVQKGQFRRTMPLVILLYVYILQGTVEITFGMSFIMWLFVLFAMVNDDQVPVEEKISKPGRKFKLRIQ